LSHPTNYETVIRQTCDYILRDMTDEAGCFHSTEDADSEGEEGKFYVWTPREIEAVLGHEAALRFCYVYDVSEHGNFEHGKSILNLPKTIEQCAKLHQLDESALQKELAESRDKLLAARNERVRPGKDDKILRQLKVHLELKSPKGLGADAQDVESGKIDLTVAVADLNEKHDIQAPKNARSVSELQQQLGVLGLGASQGGSGSGSSGGGSGGSSGSSAPNTGADQLERLRELSPDTNEADAKRAQEYLECAQDAKTADDLKVCGDKLK